MILALLALLFWLFVAAVGVQMLPWPLAASAVLIGVGIGIWRLRRPEDRAPDRGPGGRGEPYRPRTRDPEYRPRG